MFRPTEFRAAEHLTHAVQAIVLTSVVEHHTGVDQPDLTGGWRRSSRR